MDDMEGLLLLLCIGSGTSAACQDSPRSAIPELPQSLLNYVLEKAYDSEEWVELDNALFGIRRRLMPVHLRRCIETQSTVQIPLVA